MGSPAYLRAAKAAYAAHSASLLSLLPVLKDQRCVHVCHRRQPLGSRRPSETLPLAGNANKTGNTSFLGAVTTMLKFCIGTGVLAVPHAFSTGGVVPCALALLALLAWNDWKVWMHISHLPQAKTHQRTAADGGDRECGPNPAN